MAFNPADYEVDVPVQPTAPPEGQDRMAHAMRRLTEDYKWSPEIAAGIVGNLWHESGGGDTNVVGDGGKSYGLAQWNGPRRQALAKYATEKGKPMDDFDVQIDFVNHELAADHPHVIDKLWQAKSPTAAAMIFSNLYERPGTPMMGNRIKVARQAYQKVTPSDSMPNEESVPGQEFGLLAPVTGKMGGGFADTRDKGIRRHGAGDIYAEPGTPVVAPGNMQFITGGQGDSRGRMRDNDYWSHWKDIDTGMEYRFAHHGDASYYKPGFVINKGEPWNIVGDAIDDPHLHMGVVDSNGKSVDWAKDVKRGVDLTQGTTFGRLDKKIKGVAATISTGKFNPDDYVVETGGKFNPDDYMVEQLEYGVMDAIGDMFGDGYKYVKSMLSPGVNKDLEKAKVEFLKQNPDADTATVDAAHAKLEAISAAHQMPLKEAFAKNIRDFASGIITPIQGVAEAVGKKFESFGTGMKDVQRDLGLDRKVGPGRYGTEGEGEEPRGMIDQALRPEDEKHYTGEGLVRAPGRVLGTLVPYVAAGRVAQVAGLALTPASTFYEKLLFNTATFMPVDLASGYKEAGMAGVDQALWHSPITAALFTVGGLPSGKVTGTVGVGLAGAGSAAAGGERDPAKLAEAFGTMAILHNILGTKPERATAEVKDFIKENNVTDTEVRALQDKLEGFRKQYAAEQATPEQRAPEPTPEEVRAEVDRLKQEYVAGEEAALVTPADLAPEVVDALRKGQPLSPSQDIVLQDKIKAALVGQRTAPEGAAWEQHGFSPEAPGLLTDRTMAGGAEPNVPGPNAPGLANRPAEAAKAEAGLMAEQQAFMEQHKDVAAWYDAIKAERGVEAADEAFRQYQAELTKDFGGVSVTEAGPNLAAERDIAAVKEQARQAGIEDEGVTPMYSGGPDTSELMRKLAPVWYSRAQRFIGDKLPNVGTGQGLANTIENWTSKGVMPGKEEVKWTGVVPWLQERKGKVTRTEVVEFLKENGVELRVVEKGGEREFLVSGAFSSKFPTRQEAENYISKLQELGKQEPAIQRKLDQFPIDITEQSVATKFESYVKPPPGSTNYREFYGVWPSAGRKDYAKKLEAKYGPVWLTKATEAEIAELKASSNQFQAPSGHETGDPTADINRVFHAFTWDQVINGKKYLVIGELQSDWAHEGRIRGYRRELTTEEKAELDSVNKRLRLARKTLDDAQRKRIDLETEAMRIIDSGGDVPTAIRDELASTDRISDAVNEQANRLAGEEQRLIDKQGGAPPFPFSKNWMEVAMKKMLRRGAEEGYDGLAWVSGDVVKERYDLSKVYDNVSSEKVPEGYKVTATRLDNGDTVDVGVFKDAKAMKDAGIAEDMAGKLVGGKVTDASYLYKELDALDSKLNAARVDLAKAEQGYDDTRTASKSDKDIADREYAEARRHMNSLLDRQSRLYKEIQESGHGKVVLTGVDLKLGGEWANKQYDSVNPTTGQKVFGMPVFMDKYGKQWGARTATIAASEKPKTITKLPDGWKARAVPDSFNRDQYLVYDNEGRPFGGLADTRGLAIADALDILNTRQKEGITDPVHTLDITPKMKETVLEQGQYMFSGGPDTSEWFKSLFRTGNAGKVLKGMTPAQLEVASRISVGDHENKTWTTPTDYYTAIMDQVHPFKKYMEQHSKAPPKITDDPYKQGILFPGWTGKAEAFIQYHPWNRNTFQFMQNVKGLADIYRPIDAAGRIEAFRTYLTARRSVERTLKGFETGIDLDTAQQTTRELSAEFEADAKDYNKYTDSLLRYARDAGLISQERYEQINAGSVDYAPLLRVMDLESKTNGGKGFQSAQVIKQFVGSEREVIDPLESTIRLTYALINAAERNNVAASLIRWSKESGAFGDTIHEINAAAIPIDVKLSEVIKDKGVKQFLQNSGLAEKDMVIFRPSAFQPSSSTISVWENGERKFYSVPKEIADVVKGINEVSADVLTRLLSIPAQTLRLGATTLHPEFWGKNPLKDQGTAFIHSKYGYVPFVDLYRGIAEMARGGEQYWKFMISGAPHGELVSMDRRLLQNKLRDVLSGRLKMPGFLVRHPIEAAKLFAEYGERGTRVGEFQKGVAAEGNTPEGIQEAGYQAKDFTVNFSRKGGAAASKFFNMTTAFWNPGLQGVDKFVRMHKDRPLATMAKSIVAVTIPSMILEAAFGDDPMIADLPAWRKDLFFNLPTRYGPLSLPKPWTYGLLYGAIPQRIMRSILKEDPHAYDGLLEAVGRELPDFPMGTFITPFMEIETNQKRFTGTPVMPDWKKDLPAKFQFGSYTPEIMKTIGDLVSGIPVIGETRLASPVALNHVLQSWTGGSGRLVTDALDYTLRKSGILTVVPPPAARLADTPVVRAFFARYPSLDAEPLQRFRTRTVKSAAKMRFLTSQVMDMAMEGKQHQLLPLINELGPDTAMNLGKMSTAFNEMSKFAYLIERSKDMSPEQKRETIDKIYLSMISAAKETNRLVDMVLDQSKRVRTAKPAADRPDLGRSVFRQ